MQEKFLKASSLITLKIYGDTFIKDLETFFSEIEHTHPPTTTTTSIITNSDFWLH